MPRPVSVLPTKAGLNRAQAEPRHSGGARAWASFTAMMVIPEVACPISVNHFDVMSDGPQEGRHLAHNRCSNKSWASRRRPPCTGNAHRTASVLSRRSAVRFLADPRGGRERSLSPGPDSGNSRHPPPAPVGRGHCRSASGRPAGSYRRSSAPTAPGRGMPAMP